MGAGMDKILPGLYLGSIRDSNDKEQIKNNNITHILSVHDDANPGKFENIKYLCFKASDHASQDLKQFFHEAIDFIHSARLSNGNVLVHCLAGVSRSTTLVISYIMTISEMPWYDSLNAVRAARKGANPNFGFQRQLQNFEFNSIKTVRENIYSKYGIYDNKEDINHCKTLLELYHKSQEELIDNNPKNQVNCNPVKTYPFPYNAYNLDKEKPKNSNKSSENSLDNSTKTEHLTEEEKQKEAEEIVEKIFG